MINNKTLLLLSLSLCKVFVTDNVKNKCSNHVLISQFLIYVNITIILCLIYILLQGWKIIHFLLL